MTAQGFITDHALSMDQNIRKELFNKTVYWNKVKILHILALQVAHLH